MTFVVLLLASRALCAEQSIADFVPSYRLESIEARDVKLSLTAGGRLRIESGHTQEWPGITIKPAAGKWDLSRWGQVALDVSNPTATPVEVGFRIDNPGGDGGKDCIQEVITVAPVESRTFSLPLTRRMPPEFGLFGMNGYPGFGAYSAGGKAVDPANLIQIIVFVPRPKADHVFEISRIRAQGEIPPLPKKEGFFPFIDDLGQYRHAEWPGKLKSATEWPERIKAEEADLAANPRPADRDRWGGWLGGPKMKKTGYFYPAKLGNRWWLVDPDGNLFWSNGVDCLGNWAAGPVADRESWYTSLPSDDPSFKEFFWDGDARSDDRYKGRKVRYFDWGHANAFRKYGKDWKEKVADVSHRRLASWGFNTIGNWSSGDVYLKRRTPYTVAIHFGGKDLEASEGYWARFRDVFDPDFRKALRDALAGQKQSSANDPWNVGYFVDNEISWGNETDLAVWTLASPKTQKAKQVFVADLKKKYRTIGKLNLAWSASHASWDALLEARTAPDREKAGADLKAFTSKTAETYFKTCREEVRRIAPKNLYLGCRFAWVNDLAARAAAKHVDVMSYNLYRRTVGDFRLPAGLDMPVIIGEFHFGALDRGMFHTGLVPVESQAERARMFSRYLESAIGNPVFVGAHWFQYIDEPTTGRFDGENYQIGLVDICDSPYPETIHSAREFGENLYSIRK